MIAPYHVSLCYCVCLSVMDDNVCKSYIVHMGGGRLVEIYYRPNTDYLLKLVTSIQGYNYCLNNKIDLHLSEDTDDAINTIVIQKGLLCAKIITSPTSTSYFNYDYKFVFISN